MSIFHVEDGFFGQSKVQQAYNIIHFEFWMENSTLKMFCSMDVKITPDFCSQGAQCTGTVLCGIMPKFAILFVI